MSIRYWLTLLATLCFILPAFADDQPQRLKGTVTWIYDGDTIKVSDIGKVRLIGIDTPEREESNRDWYLNKQGISSSRLRTIYQAALQYNIQHAKGKTVTLELDQPARDKYGRLLAYVYLPDEKMLNRMLLEKGLAVVYRKFSFEKKRDFLEAEEVARKAGVGLWKK